MQAPAILATVLTFKEDMPSKNANALTGLRDAGSVVITDTADFNEIARFKPSEGTTNPSLLYQVAQLPQYRAILDETISLTKSLDGSLTTPERLDRAVEYLAVAFGTKIYDLTGGISTEADVTHSFDTEATVEAALRILKLYEQRNVPRTAVRIKISATWEGIQAARILERKHGVSVLITIVFGMSQAIAAAEAGVTCIAPYVGRIGDYFRANPDAPQIKGQDMGVCRVKDMQDYLRKYGYKTKIMAASFRNPEQAIALAGVDLLTIAPSILLKLEEMSGHVKAQLTEESAANAHLERVSYIDNESAFRWAFNSDACAVEKSADAMRRFAADTDSLKALIAAQL